MTQRVRQLSLVVAALAAGALAAVAMPAIAPGDGPPTTGSFIAQDFDWHVAGSSEHTLTIATGGTVTFGYPTGGYRHNVDFSGGPAPTSCAQTAGAAGSTPPPPLPRLPTPAGWSGSCEFDAPGTYAFHCRLHSNMRGTVVVEPTPPPPTTTTPPGTTTSAGGGSGSAAGSGSDGGGGSRTGPRVHVARMQRGTVLRGRVTTPTAGWRIAVRAFASADALATHPPRHSRRVRVGSMRTRSRGTAPTAFALRLSRAARAALHRHHRLVISLEVVASLTSPDEETVSATSRTVVVRP